MQRSDFYYDLPSSLIAQYPPIQRGGSRLLVANTLHNELYNYYFTNLPQLLQPGDLLIFNNTKVIQARLLGYKESGGRVEILITRLINSHEAIAYLRASKAPKPNARLFLNEKISFQVIKYLDGIVYLNSESLSFTEIMNQYGQIPLPPYIRRPPDLIDNNRYQTIYAHHAGAVAAPTAGLHFTQELLDQLKIRGIQQTAITLHVGAGSFQPVRTDDLNQHKMHEEWFEVNQEVCELIQITHQAGKRVIAVGTTSARALESAVVNNILQPACGDTSLFIRPGYNFKIIDALITNFHLPESTLLMLVAAFIGYEKMINLYQYAIAEKYRFLSYGDAMLLMRNL